ncbi:MAG: hypothetical protein M0R46_09555 [Candidatus Muirbacterium halophilum]|nr:hypothetical protein [Candidatus Muirbacterium halophilum]MCK9476154.1 hypothetical protein [Candidatus Muirbacterium halophilum]
MFNKEMKDICYFKFFVKNIDETSDLLINLIKYIEKLHNDRVNKFYETISKEIEEEKLHNFDVTVLSENNIEEFENNENKNSILYSNKNESYKTEMIIIEDVNKEYNYVLCDCLMSKGIKNYSNSYFTYVSTTDINTGFSLFTKAKYDLIFRSVFKAIAFQETNNKITKEELRNIVDFNKELSFEPAIYVRTIGIDNDYFYEDLECLNNEFKYIRDYKVKDNIKYAPFIPNIFNVSSIKRLSYIEKVILAERCWFLLDEENKNIEIDAKTQLRRNMRMRGFECNIKIKNIDKLGKFHNLEDIDLSYPEKTFLSTEFIRSMKLLKTLKLKNFMNISTEDLSELVFLIEIILTNCNLTSKKDMNLYKLKTLVLTKTTGLKDLSSFRNSFNLDIMELNNTGIKDLSHLIFFKNLKTFHITEKEIDLDSILLNNSIKILSINKELFRVYEYIFDKNNIEIKPTIKCKEETENQTIETFDIKNIANKNLSFIAKMKNLKKIKIADCEIKNINFLENFPQLEFLKLSNCSKLTNLKGLGDLQNLKILELEKLKVKNCEEDINSLKNLKTLTIIECKNIKKEKITKEIEEPDKIEFYE